jgi:hypothetical protein
MKLELLKNFLIRKVNMYKLINKGNVYELHQHDGTVYHMIAKLKSTDSLVECAETFAPRIQQSELLEALRYMVKDNHNIAEFGYNGIFTVSYKE